MNRHASVFRAARLSGLDALLVVVVLIWGTNYSVIKHAFAEVPSQPFNALRLLLASSLFQIAIQVAGRRARTTGARVPTVFHTSQPLTRRDRVDLVWLGLLGHFAYQMCFSSGVAATSVSNAALIIGATPVAIATLSAALGRERIGPLHWTGAAVSVAGIYLIVGHAASFGGATRRGDLLVMASVACWAVYTIGAARLVARHSPLYVTGMTMTIGAMPYVVTMLPAIARVDWIALSPGTWASLVLSALLALCVSYLIWYAAVRRLGAARTAVYANGVPIVAMTVAALWLHEPMSGAKLAGAAAVLTGVFLTRFGRTPTPLPVEE
jgi:drug/metabolite transporter (DMT)-like permease